MTPPPKGKQEVRAAGGVLWRSSEDGPELLLVHRPRYDDWSLPKGKHESGETDEQCAVREVLEETGHEVRVGPCVYIASYDDAYGRAKEVVYFDLETIGGSFEANDEVDEVRWLTPDAARSLLSYSRDTEVIDAFLEQRRSS